MILYFTEYGALSQGILISLASTFLIAVDTWRFIEAPYPAFLGCLIAIIGFGLFDLYEQLTAEQQHDLLVSVSFWLRNTETLLINVWITDSSMFCSCDDILGSIGIHRRCHIPGLRD